MLSPSLRLRAERMEERILHSVDMAPLLMASAADDSFVQQPLQAVSADAAVQRSEIVFVDLALPDAPALLVDLQAQRSAGRPIEVVTIDAGQDGIAGIDAALTARRDISAVHVLAHGSDGALQLGSATLDAQTLLRRAGEVAAWSTALAADAELLLYGGDLAQTAAGQRLLQDLAALTGVDTKQATSSAGATIAAAPNLGTAAAVPAAGTLAPQLASLPLNFEANLGQADAGIDFIARGSGVGIALIDGNALLNLKDGAQGNVVRMTLVGAATDVQAQAEGAVTSRSNYIIGDSDPSLHDVPNYAAVRYDGVYDGIDLRYYGQERQLEYDFIVASGADWRSIAIDFQGVETVAIDANGALRLTLADAAGGTRTIHFNAPVSYQDGANGREAVDSRYVIGADGRVRFDVGAYDSSRALVIDPVLAYGSYLGGTGVDKARAIAADTAGNTYVTGETASAAFPTTVGAYDTAQNGGSDVFVTKLNASGTAVVYSTFIGGSGDDLAWGIAVDAAGNAYVTGSTTSLNLPTFNPFQGARSGTQDAFLFKLNATGTALAYSTYFGGSGSAEVGYGIALDAAGNAYITGDTDSASGIASAGAYDTTLGGSMDAFLAKFDPALSGAASRVFGSYLGGSSGSNGADHGLAVAVDTAGNAYVSGYTVANNFPTTASAYDSTPNSGDDAFLTVFNAAGNAITYSTYLGGAGNDSASGIALDAANKVYLSGSAGSGFPTKNAYDATYGGGTWDAIVAKIDPTQSGNASLVYSTYLGGAGTETAPNIVVDSLGRAHVIGVTSGSFPTTADALQATYAGGTNDAFYATLGSNGDSLVYSTYLGGNGDDVGYAITRDAGNNIYLAGYSASANFQQITGGAYDTTANGNYDAFVAKFSSQALVVTTTNDVVDGSITSIAALLANKGADGLISLREAIIATNNTAGADAIALAAGTYTLSRTGANENAALTGDLDVTDDLTITGAGANATIINGGGLDRVFELYGSTVTISGITVRNGSTNDGAGIRLDGSSNLTLRDAALSGNIATSTGGGILSSGTLTLDRVTIDGNRADVGGGIAVADGGSATLVDVTVSGNTAVSIGGGISTRGAATLTNSTIAYNSAGAGAGINKAGSGTATLKNALLANNTGGNANGALTSAGNNLDSDGTAGLAGAGDLNGTLVAPIDPKLGPLQNNGGTISTHALLAGSLAINAGSASGAPVTDARGVARLGATDIGAYESTLVAYEPFAYPAGSFNGANGGSGWASGWSSVGSSTTVAPSGLQNPAYDMPVSGGTAQLTVPSLFGTVTQTRDLSTSLGAAGTTAWISFLVKPDSLVPGDYIGLQVGSASATRAFVGINGNQFVLEQAGSGGRVVVSGITPMVGQTYLLTLKMDFTAGADNMTLYVNPTPGLSGPDSAFNVSKNNLDLGTFTQIDLAGGRTLAANNASLDEVRIASSYLDVAPARTTTQVAPVITSNGGGASAAVSVAENATAVTTVIAADADLPAQTLTYSISGGADAAKFSINASTGALSFVTAPNYEAPTDAGANNVYDVIVQASDGALSDTQAIAVTVTDVSEPLQITAAQDTYINSGSASNFGTSTSLVVDRSGGNLGNGRALLQFDLSAIPAGATITGATLQLQATANASPFMIDVYRLTEAWVEGNGGTSAANWNSRLPGTAWTNINGASVDPTPAATWATLPPAGAGLHSWDLTNLVRAWQSGSAANYGILLGSAQGGSTTVTYGSSESATPPRLVVSYTPSVAPVITSNGGGASAAVSVAENATAVTTVTASDADLPAQTLTYSISGGADAAQFSIDAGTGMLSFVTAPNYEAPTDAGANNVYDVVVQVSDGTLTDSQAIAVTVTPVNDNNPVVTSNGGGASAAVSVAENVTAVTTVTATDADLPAQTLTYAISGGADAARFSIDASTGVLSFATAPNYEAPTDAGANNVYDVIVQVSDGTLTDSQAIAVTVTPVNDNNPVVTSNGGGASAAVSVAENVTAVTTVTATDADLPAQTLTYAISGGADAARFSIDASTGVLSFATAPNFEAPTDSGANNVYDVTVRVSDGTRTDTQAIAVTVSDVNEFPVGPVGDVNATANSVAENAGVGTVVGLTARAVDPDATNNAVTYALDDSAGGRFAINAATGVVSVAGALDYETSTSHTITVRATSADGSFATGLFTIAVTDVNDAGVGAISDSNAATNSVAENAAAGTLVGLTASALDPDVLDVVTYSLTDNAGGRFAINPTTGAVVVAGALDAELATSHTIVVRADSTDGSFNTQNFTVGVADVNEFGIGAVSDSDAVPNAVDENAAIGTLVGVTALATDADATNSMTTYTLDDSAGGRFAIDGATGVVTVAGAIDREAAPSHTITVRATSADGSVSILGFTIAVNPLNDNAPDITSDGGGVSASIGVAENTGAVTTVVASDADLPAQPLTYSIVGGADQALFNIDVATGALSFVTAPDFENPRDAGADNIYDVTVQASDGSLNTTQAISVTVNPVDDNTPVITSDGGGTSASIGVAENSSVVTTVMASDADLPALTLAYAIVGGADQTLFAIDAATGVLTFVNAPDYENPSSAGTGNNYYVDVGVSDGTLASVQSIRVTVNPVNDNAPDITSDGGGVSASIGVAENTGAVTTVVASDADLPAQTLIYSIVGGADQALFNIDAATGALSFVTAPDFENPTDAGANNVYDVTVQASDGSLSTTQAISVTVIPIDDSAPVITSNGGGGSAALSVAENATAVTIVTATDADLPAQTLTYSISGGADAARFTIDSSTGVLSFVTAPNFEAPVDLGGNNVYDLTVRVSDGSLSSSQAVSVVVGNVNEAPFGAPAILGTASENQTLAADTGSIGDGDGLGGLSYQWLRNGAVVAGATGATYTLGDADVGARISLSVSYTDGGGTVETLTSAATAAVANVNDAPSIVTTIPDQSATEAASFSFTLPAGTFTDVDAGDTLSYGATLASGAALPSWLSFNATTQTLSGTPANADVGTITVRVTATDSANATAFGDFTLTVANVNDAPVLAQAVTNQSTTQGAGFAFTLPAGTFSDIDTGDTLGLDATLVSGAALPAWLGFDAATRTFSGTPGNGDVGQLSIRVTATDAAGAAAFGDFTLTVANVNDAPVLAIPIGDQAVAAGSTAQFRLPGATFTDPDAGDTLRYAATLADGSALPAWLAFDEPSLSFSAAPSALQTGVFVVRVTATDPAGAAAQAVFALIVATPADNTPPAAFDAGQFPSPPAAGAAPSLNSVATPEKAPAAAPPAARATAAPPDVSTGVAAPMLESLSAEPTLTALFDAPRRDTADVSNDTGSRLSSRADAVLASAGVTEFKEVSFGSMLQLLQGEDLTRRLEELQRHMLEQGGERRTVVASAIAATSGLSIGYVIWLVRGGVLVSSMLSALPAWQMIDPLPVVAAAGAGRSRRPGSAADDADVERLFDDHRKRDKTPTSVPARQQGSNPAAPNRPGPEGRRA